MSAGTFGNTSTGGPSGLGRHRVREAVQEAILSGEYQPGQRLVQQELAQRFGVAQSVVRESLLELQYCGLVNAVDNLGMFVSGLDGATLLSAYQIREMFEGLAARLCCEKASRADIRHLTELAQRNYQLARAGEIEEMGAVDRQFHFDLIRFSGNELLPQLTESYRVLGMFVRANRKHNDVRREHLAIVQAIADDRPDDAERLAREHARAARKAVQREIDDGTWVPHFVTQAAPAVVPTKPVRRGQGRGRATKKRKRA